MQNGFGHLYAGDECILPLRILFLREFEKLMFNRFFIFFVLLIMLCSLCACSSKSTTEVSTRETMNEVQIPVETEKEEKDYIIPVLLYHNLDDNYTVGNHITNISPSLFEEHMLGLLERGYNPIFVSDYYEYINDGKELPENPIMVTFDDGYLSNYEYAYPILKKLNIPATIFVVTSTVGEEVSGGKVNTPHFTWEQAKEMQDSGIIDIQSHSYSHKNMSKISDDELFDELTLSKDILVEKLSKDVLIFAYPYGGYNDKTLEKVIEVGYNMQVLVTNVESNLKYLAVNSVNGLDKFSRLTVSGDMSVQDLYDMIDASVSNVKLNS